jgi:hypothetical protein
MDSNEWVCHVLISKCHTAVLSVSRVDPSPMIVIAIKKTVTSQHTSSVVILYNVGVLETPFRLLIGFISISHLQSFMTLCHIYTAYNLTLCNYIHLQSFITMSDLHSYNPYMPIFHSWHLHIFTLRNQTPNCMPPHSLRNFVNSCRELTPRIHFLRLS